MPTRRIRKMPHHLRRVRGIYQYRRWIPEEVRTAVAQITGKYQESFIRSTGTGNLREAERIRDDPDIGLDAEYRRLMVQARLASDPRALATGLIERAAAKTAEQEHRRPRHRPAMHPRLVNVFEKLDALLAVEREVGPEQRDNVDTLIHEHYEQRNAHIRNLSALVADIKSALSDPLAPEEFDRVRDNILGTLAPPAQSEREPVIWKSVFDNWKNQYRLDDTDKKANHMRNRWRDLFAWLAEHRDYPAEWSTQEGVLRADMARITADDLDDFKEHVTGLMNASDSKVRIEPKTVEDRLRQITGLFNHAVKEMRKKELSEAIAAFRVPRGETDAQNKYQDFTLADIRTILIKARVAPPEIRWPMWIGAYSGGRLAEIVEAQTNDVEVMADGTVVFHIRRENRPGKQATLKTAQISERPVPLHDAVLAENFLAYVEMLKRDRYNGGDGPLFPQFKLWRGRLNTDASDRIMRWLRDEVGISHPRKVFHSWRHTVKTRFRETDENDMPYISREDVADKLTGHAGGTIGRTYGYFPIPTLRAAIRRVPAWPLE